MNSSSHFSTYERRQLLESFLFIIFFMLAVTILAREDRESFTLGPEAEAELLEAIEEADRGEFISGDELLRELRRA